MLRAKPCLQSISVYIISVPVVYVLHKVRLNKPLSLIKNIMYVSPTHHGSCMFTLECHLHRRDHFFVFSSVLMCNFEPSHLRAHFNAYFSKDTPSHHNFGSIVTVMPLNKHPMCHAHNSGVCWLQIPILKIRISIIVFIPYLYNNCTWFSRLHKNISTCGP